MYRIRGFNFAANTTKTAYVAQALGVDYDYVEMIAAKGELKTPEHFKRHPLGKVPTLEHDDKAIFESNTICKYMAQVEGSELLPTSAYEGALVDQWLNFFTNHLGRWFTVCFFEKHIRALVGGGDPNEANLEEANGFILQMLPAIEKHLQAQPYFAGENLSVADYVAFAYFEAGEQSDISFADYPAVEKWYRGMQAREEIALAKKKMGVAGA